MSNLGISRLKQTNKRKQKTGFQTNKQTKHSQWKEILKSNEQAAHIISEGITITEYTNCLKEAGNINSTAS